MAKGERVGDSGGEGEGGECEEWIKAVLNCPVVTIELEIALTRPAS